jgi:hypothetical protein
VASVELGLLEVTTLTDLEVSGRRVGDEVGTVEGAMLKERGRSRRSSTREEDDDAPKGGGCTLGKMCTLDRPQAKTHGEYLSRVVSNG